METIDSYKLGDSVPVNPQRDLMVGQRTGLVQCLSGWLKVELVETEEAPEFMRSRRPLQDQSSPPDPPKAVEPEKAEPPCDARTLFVDTDEQGVRFKEWRLVVSESQLYSYEDWPHEGPATVHHLLKHVGKYGGDPKLWLELWCRQKNIAEQDRVKHELRCLMEVLYLGGTFDQLNMPVLASFETVARRVQSIVDAYSVGSGSAPDWGNAKLFTGYAGPDDLVMPQLKTWAARRGKEEVELFNARSKMKELRRGAPVVEEAAAAAADGSLPAGSAPKNRAPRRRGKGLKPPAQAS